MRIEAQGKYLQSVLEKAQESIGRQNTGTLGLEAAKVQLSELVSQVSNQCINSAFSGMKELSELCLQQPTHPKDFSADSCLTSCEGQELYENPLGLKPMNFKYLPTANDNVENTFATETNPNSLWMSIGLNQDERLNGEQPDAKCLGKNTNSTSLMKTDKQKKPSSEVKLPFFPTKLDLNTNDEKDVASSYKQLDLNGFSWS